MNEIFSFQEQRIKERQQIIQTNSSQSHSHQIKHFQESERIRQKNENYLISSLKKSIKSISPNLKRQLYMSTVHIMNFYLPENLQIANTSNLPAPQSEQEMRQYGSTQNNAKKCQEEQKPLSKKQKSKKESTIFSSSSQQNVPMTNNDVSIHEYQCQQQLTQTDHTSKDDAFSHQKQTKETSKTTATNLLVSSQNINKADQLQSKKQQFWQTQQQHCVDKDDEKKSKKQKYLSSQSSSLPSTMTTRTCFYNAQIQERIEQNFFQIYIDCFVTFFNHKSSIDDSKVSPQFIKSIIRPNNRFVIMDLLKALLDYARKEFKEVLKQKMDNIDNQQRYRRQKCLLEEKLQSQRMRKESLLDFIKEKRQRQRFQLQEKQLSEQKYQRKNCNVDVDGNVDVNGDGNGDSDSSSLEKQDKIMKESEDERGQTHVVDVVNQYNQDGQLCNERNSVFRKAQKNSKTNKKQLSDSKQDLPSLLSVQLAKKGKQEINARTIRQPNNSAATNSKQQRIQTEPQIHQSHPNPNLNMIPPTTAKKISTRFSTINNNNSSKHSTQGLSRTGSSKPTSSSSLFRLPSYNNFLAFIEFQTKKLQLQRTLAFAAQLNLQKTENRINNLHIQFTKMNFANSEMIDKFFERVLGRKQKFNYDCRGLYTQKEKQKKKEFIRFEIEKFQQLKEPRLDSDDLYLAQYAEAHIKNAAYKEELRMLQKSTNSTSTNCSKVDLCSPWLPLCLQLVNNNIFNPTSLCIYEKTTGVANSTNPTSSLNQSSSSQSIKYHFSKYKKPYQIIQFLKESIKSSHHSSISAYLTSMLDEKANNSKTNSMSANKKISSAPGTLTTCVPQVFKKFKFRKALFIDNRKRTTQFLQMMSSIGTSKKQSIFPTLKNIQQNFILNASNQQRNSNASKYSCGNINLNHKIADRSSSSHMRTLDALVDRRVLVMPPPPPAQQQQVASQLNYNMKKISGTSTGAGMIQGSGLSSQQRRVIVDIGLGAGNSRFDDCSSKQQRQNLVNMCGSSTSPRAKSNKNRQNPLAQPPSSSEYLNRLAAKYDISTTSMAPNPPSVPSSGICGNGTESNQLIQQKKTPFQQQRSTRYQKKNMISMTRISSNNLNHNPHVNNSIISTTNSTELRSNEAFKTIVPATSDHHNPYTDPRHSKAKKANISSNGEVGSCSSVNKLLMRKKSLIQQQQHSVNTTVADGNCAMSSSSPQML